MLAKLYKSLVRPLMEYTDVVWDGCPGSVIVICLNLSSMNQLKRSLVLWGYYSRRRSLDELAWEDLITRRSMLKLILFFKIINKLTPDYLSDLLPPTTRQRSGLSLRSAYNLTLFPCRTEGYKKS